MQRRDILLDQVNQMGRILGKILVDILDLNADGFVNGGLNTINEQFKSEVGLDFEELMKLSKEELKEVLVHKNFTKEHLEALSDCLSGIATHEMESNPTGAIQKLQKALEVLEIADEHFQTMSLSRSNKQQQIKNKIKKIK